MILSPHFRNRIAARPALWLSAAYLGITFPLLAADTVRSTAGVVALHAVLLVITLLLAWSGARFPRGEDLEALLPLALMPALYAELPWLIKAVGRPLQDPLVIGWEQRVFAGEPARDLASAHPAALLSNVLHLCYLCYYLLIFVPPALLFLRRRRRELVRTVFALTAVFAACYVVFIAFPVEGPRYLWPPGPAPHDQPVRALTLRILAAGSSRGTAFPSSHVAVAVVQTVYALHYQRWLGYACLALTIGIGTGAVYGGFHYAVDVLAGAAYGLAVAVLVWRVPLAARMGAVRTEAALGAVAGEAAIVPASRMTHES